MFIGFTVDRHHTMAWLLRLGLFGVLLAVVWFRFIVPDQVRLLYERAEEEFRNERYEQALQILQEALKLSHTDTRVNALAGLSHLQLGQPREAQPYLERAYRSDPSDERTKRGFAFASVALNHGGVAVPLFQELLSKHPDDRKLRLGLAEAYLKSGQNFPAARIYREIADHDPPDSEARRALVRLYGHREYRPDLPLELPAAGPASATPVLFRARGDYLQVLRGSEWQDLYIVGVNIGPARPGEFPATASRDFETYQEWLRAVAAMNSNTIRVYSVLPPAFYQALRAHNDLAPAPLWLIQEVWIDDTAENLYDPGTERMFSDDLKHTIDLLHGRADLPFRPGRNYGVYTADVSPWVLALAVGREVEPKLAQFTNFRNPSHTQYKGRFVSLPEGNPTEAWFARMCDLAATYELETYNAQRPLTVVNWPPLDPLAHPTETRYADELQVRRRLGENVSTANVPQFMNDADAVSVDVVKFRAEPQFTSGIFALYHVYQHWPDFLLHEARFAQASDSVGPNRYLGYLQELKKAHPNVPLLVGEYGLASSLGAAHLHPEGWGNGGLTEKQQAELLVRFSRNIRDTRCAGGLVFEWIDEWFKHVHDNYTADFERPWDRDTLWSNVLDPEENFGLNGFEPAEPVPLLRGEAGDWLRAEQLYATGIGGASQPGGLRAAYALSDYGYLYLRLDTQPGPVDWNSVNYWIALNTLPGQSGSRLLPGIDVRWDSGTNFLLQLRGPANSRLLVAENYDPNHRMPLATIPKGSRILRRIGMQLALADSADFQEVLTEANEPRYTRDGHVFPPLEFNRSRLPFGTADRDNPNYLSSALWYADATKGIIELRIPWGLLLVMDPSDRRAFAGTDQNGTPVSRPMSGVSIAVFALMKQAASEPLKLRTALPSVENASLTAAPALYKWNRWDRAETRMYPKESYHALTRVFGEFLGLQQRPRPATRTSTRAQ